jgi:hypothetical protein
MPYTIKDTVMSADGSRVYFALQDVPVGVEITDTAYWKLQIDLSTTKSDMESATSAANAAAEKANAAATFSLVVDVNGDGKLNGKAFTVDADGNVTF